MHAPGWILLAATGVIVSGCSRPAPPAHPETAAAAAEAPQITQFYATAPRLARGERELLCYGVEGATAVRLEPPRQELSAALSRCVEVHPDATTTYKLTAEGPGGAPAVREVTVTVGAPKARIITVDVSALTVAEGSPVSICYKVENARAVEIAPVHFHAGEKPEGCTMVQPNATTTYTVTALGAAGDRDQEHVTIKVK